MTVLTETYLGNQATDRSLQQQVWQAQQAGTLLEVYLQPADSNKGRIHAFSTTGIELGIIKSREQSLGTGDLFAMQSGQLLLVNLTDQTVMTLSVNGDVSQHAIDLIYLGHVLGNHHWPILVHGNRIYVEMVADRAVMETTVRNVKIPNLCIDYEVRSAATQIQFSTHAHH